MGLRGWLQLLCMLVSSSLFVVRDATIFIFDNFPALLSALTYLYYIVYSLYASWYSNMYKRGRLLCGTHTVRSSALEIFNRRGVHIFRPISVSECHVELNESLCFSQPV